MMTTHARMVARFVATSVAVVSAAAMLAGALSIVAIVASSVAACDTTMGICLIPLMTLVAAHFVVLVFAVTGMVYRDLFDARQADRDLRGRIPIPSARVVRDAVVVGVEADGRLLWRERALGRR